MGRLAAIVLGILLGLQPSPAEGRSAWGSPAYGDPPGWCTNHSDMWTATVVTNDPSVGTNPERDTFYGFHPHPGYDDWYGFFYGDFRGRPGDASGWVKLLHEDYPNHYHWNFADSGWAVHGRAKEYIAYYNWTFGGECGIGRYRNLSPPPYMADQYGYPVVDIYVDAVAPPAPQPRVSRVTAGSVSFTWDPVIDVGDGAGADYFASGMDHYVSWLTLNGGSRQMQLASTSQPRTVTQARMTPVDVACVHVQAFDRVQNASLEKVACSKARGTPPTPPWDLAVRVAANPARVGLVGLDSWFWLDPSPRAVTVHETEAGVDYAITATPMSADWDFGDGAGTMLAGPAGYGQRYPQPSSVTHMYEAHSQAGYTVRAWVRYAVMWTASIGGQVVGPYPMDPVTQAEIPLNYPVEQAQPELLRI